MENAEEVFQFLEEFSNRKPKIIPQELNDYLAYVARTGDPVYQWSLVKCLFKEKFLNVITDFYETTPGIEIPPYPNVDPFIYDVMKNSLLERFDSFTSAPFTVQRICELLTYPRKQYNRVDKFMRAIEKNILVVSTREPGTQRHIEAENGEIIEPIVNGSDNNSEYNVDVEMEDMSWKESSAQQSLEPQPSSSEAHITVDDIEARLQAKDNVIADPLEKTSTQYESVTPPEVSSEEQSPESKPSEEPPSEPTVLVTKVPKDAEMASTSNAVEDPKDDTEMKPSPPESVTLVIPEIKVDDAEMTEQKLNEQKLEEVCTVDHSIEKLEKESGITEKESGITESESVITESKSVIEAPQVTQQIDESSSDFSVKDGIENKPVSEPSTFSEESSSSDNTDGYSNSPKTDNEVNTDNNIDIQEESNQTSNLEDVVKSVEQTEENTTISKTEAENPNVMESDNYSISDVKSELPKSEPEPTQEAEVKAEEVTEPPKVEEIKDAKEGNKEAAMTNTEVTET